MRRGLLAVSLLAVGCTMSRDEATGSGGETGLTSADGSSSSTSSSSDTGADSVGACDATTAGVFATVFAEHCNTPGCHAGHQPAVGLDLSSAATVEAELVGVASACDGSPLVVPGDPEASLLYRKLTSTQTCGVPMPVGAALEPALVECIGAWIDGLSATCEQCGGDTCIDTTADPQHCGTCDRTCPSEAPCVDGECVCPDEASLCADACVDTASDPAHCGGCDQPCAMFCLQGECVADCGALQACDGACVDMATNDLHCGGCDQPCGTGMTCVDAACACEGEIVSFAAQVEPLLAAECTAMGCHGFPAPKEGLDLRVGNSYAGLVGVDSGQCNGRLRVAPGDPANSYLVDKLLDVDICFGTQMPKANQALAAADIAAIEAWICQGAPDN